MKKIILYLLSFSAAILLGGNAISKASADEIWTIGDSTSWGWDGHSNVDPWINQAGSDLNAYTNKNHSKSGASIQSNFRSYVKDFENDPYKNRATWVVVNMGVNDVNYGNFIK